MRKVKLASGASSATESIRLLEQRFEFDLAESERIFQKSVGHPITVVENFWGDWQIIGKTPAVQKKDANKVEFEVAVPADGETVFEYQVLFRG